MKKVESDLSGRIIGAAIRVHRELGPGFLESVYEEALCIELAASGLEFTRQMPVEINYQGKKAGEHRLDLLVGEGVVVELKAVTELHDIFFATMRSYLKAANGSLGLLLNFAATTLQVRRVGREWHSRVE
ncbi:MAG: GxxExxY protein [Opitutaceae bacterium]|jgi:GxxExxY protein